MPRATESCATRAVEACRLVWFRPELDPNPLSGRRPPTRSSPALRGSPNDPRLRGRANLLRRTTAVRTLDLREKQRREPRCPARKMLPIQRIRATSPTLSLSMYSAENGLLREPLDGAEATSPATGRRKRQVPDLPGFRRLRCGFRLRAEAAPLARFASAARFRAITSCRSDEVGPSRG